MRIHKSMLVSRLK